MHDAGALPPRPNRFHRDVEVRLREAGRPDVLLGPASHSINISRNGLLVEILGPLDVVAGEDVVVSLRWEGGSFESPATIVRFDSPYQGDPGRQAMALQLRHPVPRHVIAPTP